LCEAHTKQGRKGEGSKREKKKNASQGEKKKKKGVPVTKNSKRKTKDNQEKKIKGLGFEPSKGWETNPYKHQRGGKKFSRHRNLNL